MVVKKHSPFWYLPEGDYKADLLYDYNREKEAIEEMEKDD